MRPALLSLAIAVLGCAHGGGPPLARDGTILAEAESLRRDFGPRIDLDAEGADFLPTVWTRRPIFGRAEAATDADVARALLAVRRVFDRYPRSLVARELNRVAIAGRLVFYRRDYGGTNDRDAIYLTCRGLDEGFDDAHLRGVLHAEFSSVLWRNHADLFDRRSFEASLPSGFAYEGSGVEVLHRRDLDASDPEDLAAGFLTRYARSSLENDLNTLVRGMMLRPEELVSLARRHPRLRRKALVVARFYTALGVSSAAEVAERLSAAGA